MFVRACVAACLSMLLLTSAADATAIHGRGPRAEAWMYAQLAGRGHQRVQVLTRLCVEPSRIRHCFTLPQQLRRAIERALDRPVTWVDARRNHGPKFLVFAPIALGRDTARASFAWWDPDAYACRGGTQLNFANDHGAWRVSLVGSLGWAVGCP